MTITRAMATLPLFSFLRIGETPFQGSLSSGLILLGFADLLSALIAI
jgi:hypothetical protein